MVWPPAGRVLAPCYGDTGITVKSARLRASRRPRPLCRGGQVVVPPACRRSHTVTSVLPCRPVTAPRNPAAPLPRWVGHGGWIPRRRPHAAPAPSPSGLGYRGRSDNLSAGVGQRRLDTPARRKPCERSAADPFVAVPRFRFAHQLLAPSRRNLTTPFAAFPRFGPDSASVNPSDADPDRSRARKEAVLSYWVQLTGRVAPGQNGECPRPNDQSMTKPETRTPTASGDVGHGSFGLHGSLGLRHG